MKLTAILILLLSLIFAGYRLLFYFLQKSTNLATRPDAAPYNKEGLISIKVPPRIFYRVKQKDREHMNTKIKAEGKRYPYVKKEISAGRPVLLCLYAGTTITGFSHL